MKFLSYGEVSDNPNIPSREKLLVSERATSTSNVLPMTYRKMFLKFIKFKVSRKVERSSVLSTHSGADSLSPNYAFTKVPLLSAKKDNQRRNAKVSVVPP